MHQKLLHNFFYLLSIKRSIDRNFYFTMSSRTLKKGSKEAKLRMAYLRSLRGKGKILHKKKLKGGFNPLKLYNMAKTGAKIVGKIAKWFRKREEKNARKSIPWNVFKEHLDRGLETIKEQREKALSQLEPNNEGGVEGNGLICHLKRKRAIPDGRLFIDDPE